MVVPSSKIGAFQETVMLESVAESIIGGDAIVPGRSAQTKY